MMPLYQPGLALTAVINIVLSGRVEHSSSEVLMEELKVFLALSLWHNHAITTQRKAQNAPT